MTNTGIKKQVITRWPHKKRKYGNRYYVILGRTNSPELDNVISEYFLHKYDKSYTAQTPTTNTEI